MRVFEALSTEAAGLSFSEIGSRTGIEKSGLSRVLSTLEQGGYIICDANSKKFRIGLGFVAIAFRYMDATEFYDFCAPVLQDVSQKTGELVQLAVVEGDGLKYVAKVEGVHRIRLHSLLGQEAVLHASSAGKVWLASLSQERALALALKSGLTRLTDKTICSIERFLEELATVRRQGYATVVEEMIEGGAAIGVPIRVTAAGHDAVVGAVVLALPAYRFPHDRVGEFVSLLTNAAERLAMVWPMAFRATEQTGSPT